MSQPRRRRRRRRRGSSARGGEQQVEGGQGRSTQRVQQAPSGTQPSSGRRRRRRRGAVRRGGTEAASPVSSEDIFRRDRTPPEVVGAPHDGRTLESVIGQLQSEWGVPQNPQEYRITLKVSEERELRGERVTAIDEVTEDVPQRASGQPRREKAPAAPRIGGGSASTPDEVEASVARRSRGRRRRRRGR